MAGRDELQLAFRAIERAEHAIDAVAGIAEYEAHAPLVQSGTTRSLTVWGMARLRLEAGIKGAAQIAAPDHGYFLPSPTVGAGFLSRSCAMSK